MDNRIVYSLNAYTYTMLRVGNLDKSIDFYVNRLGMTLLRRKDYPHGKFSFFSGTVQRKAMWLLN